MKIVVWLGNYPREYDNTRHNIWFMFLDFFQRYNDFDDFKFEQKFKWEISIWKIWIEKIILLKPHTYMNLSWESIKLLTQYYKIDISDIVVIYDDMSMDFGKLRFRKKGSAWGHNWIKNMIKHFWEEFSRIKIWVWFNEKYEVSDWVLSKFSSSELNEMDKIFGDMEDMLKENL